MSDWLKEKLTERERMAYRIAITNSKDPQKVDEEFYVNLVIQSSAPSTSCQSQSPEKSEE